MKEKILQSLRSLKSIIQKISGGTAICFACLTAGAVIVCCVAAGGGMLTMITTCSLQMMEREDILSLENASNIIGMCGLTAVVSFVAGGITYVVMMITGGVAGFNLSN